MIQKIVENEIHLFSLKKKEWNFIVYSSLITYHAILHLCPKLGRRRERQILHEGAKVKKRKKCLCMSNYYKYWFFKDKWNVKMKLF